MTADTRTLADLAGEAYDWFVTRDRIEAADSDSPDASYVTLKDDAPGWLQNLVFHAHGDGSMLPDDWRYRTTRDALGYIHDDADEDSADEFEDQAVDTYTSDRIEWLGSHGHRPAYCDEAARRTRRGRPRDRRAHRTRPVRRSSGSVLPCARSPAGPARRLANAAACGYAPFDSAPRPTPPKPV